MDLEKKIKDLRNKYGGESSQDSNSKNRSTSLHNDRLIDYNYFGGDWKWSPFYVVGEGHSVIVTRFGEARKKRKDKDNLCVVKGPGLRAKIPLIDSLFSVNVQEYKINPQIQEIYTKDAIPVNIDAILTIKIRNDPISIYKSVFGVKNLEETLRDFMDSLLFKTVNEKKHDDVLKLNGKEGAKLLYQALLRDYSGLQDRWGFDFIMAEVEQIKPNKKVAEAINDRYTAGIKKKEGMINADRDLYIKEREGDGEAYKEEKNLLAKAKGYEEIRKTFNKEGSDKVVIDNVVPKFKGNMNFYHLRGGENILDSVGGLLGIGEKQPYDKQNEEKKPTGDKK